MKSTVKKKKLEVFSILEYNEVKAKRFFLKEESYYNFDLPIYFSLQNLINKVSKKIGAKLLSDFYGTTTDAAGKKLPAKPDNFEDVNYKFLNNKDGKFAYRPFQLIHPAIYVSLINQITTKENWNTILKRFEDFRKDKKILCLSLPLESKGINSDKATSIFNWWREIEQKSIELALDYEYVLHTDISDCYGSLYTHSIVWVLHGKAEGKSKRDDKKLIGNLIDWQLQDMAFGQTNGIPQGSVLMDFIAEMVLGFADLELSNRIDKLGVTDFQIIRYRDDYRVFANNPQVAELILKNITEILIDLGMKLNSQKTLVSNNVVQDSIKPDKYFWLANKRKPFKLQENLLVIHSLSQKFPNSGTLVTELSNYFDKIKPIKRLRQNIPVLISILIDIAYKNPKTYPIAAAILSKLLNLIKSKPVKKEILDSIIKRFDKIPNTGHLQIWLQRITLKIDDKIPFDERLCKKIDDSKIPIWNSDWLSKDFRNLISNEDIVDRKALTEMDAVIDSEEVELFESKTSYGY